MKKSSISAESLQFNDGRRCFGFWRQNNPLWFDIKTDLIWGNYILTNDGEHENQEQRDQNDVADGFHGNDDALDDMLEAFGPVNGTERT